MHARGLSTCKQILAKRVANFRLNLQLQFCLAAVLFIFYPNLGFVRACDLPVCDIDAQIKAMESKNAAFRFQAISKLRQDFGKEKNEVKLNNLLNFSKAAVALITRLQDEDYILREAKSLRDQTLVLLVQWIWRDCQRLSSAYEDLASETQRFATLDFFLRQVNSLKTEAEIRELVCFAQNAEATSFKLSDADYVARQAVQLGAALSTQLLEVVNGWEGVFRLTRIDSPLAADLEDLRLILFSSGGELGIVASITHPTLRPTIFQKMSFIDNPQTLSSRQSFASAVPSVIQLKFDDKFESFEGSVLDPIDFKKIEFAGERQIGIPAFARTPCSEDEVLGAYKTTLSGLKGRVAIERIGPKQLAAIFSSEGGELRLPFSFGRYNEKTGRLTFINLQVSVPLGWRLLAEKSESERCTLTGWGLSTFNGSYYPLVLNPESNFSKQGKSRNTAKSKN